MKILVLTPNFPSPTWGAGTRNYYLLKALAMRHTVSLLSLIDREEDLEKASLLEDFVHTVKCVVRPVTSLKRFQQLSYLARRKSYFIGLNTFVEVQRVLDALLLEGSYDMVLFESALMANYHLPDGIKCVIDEHNVEYELLWRTFRHERMGWRKWYNWWEGRVLKPGEIALCRKADLVLTTSEQDRHTLQNALSSTYVEVVPNGVDAEVFQRTDTDPSSHQIIFTGAMNYYPNREAVMTFAKNCWPLIRAQVPDATWVIAGREPPPEVKSLRELPGVTVTGAVADIRPSIAPAAVAIAPLRIGSGTRLKILEAFAMGKAVVSTSLGCEGLSVRPGEHLLVADHPEEFARAVIDLLGNPELRTRLGNAGRRLIEEEYSWERCGSQLLRILEHYVPEREQVC